MQGRARRRSLGTSPKASTATSRSAPIPARRRWSCARRAATDASTIHSMIYRSRESDENGPQFVLNRQSAAAKADLDRHRRMLDGRRGARPRPPLLRAAGARARRSCAAAAGEGRRLLHRGEPDVMLTEVHRQAQDNPIVHMSMKVREGGRLDPAHYGESRVIRRREIDAEAVMRADQVLVGLNKTRRLYNTRIRELQRLPRPDAGGRREARLPAQRQDRRGCSTAAPGRCKAMRRPARRSSSAWTCLPEDESRRKPVEVSVLQGVLRRRGGGPAVAARRDSDEFTYGYALTVHKAQGSQWDDRRAVRREPTPSASTAVAGSTPG